MQKISQALWTILFVVAIFAIYGNAQSRTNRLTRPCAGSATPASVSIAVGGAISITPCSGKTVTIAGAITSGSDISVPDEAYDATAWNGSLEVPTKNALRDKLETITAALVMGNTPSDGVANALIKTNGSSQVANTNGLVNTDAAQLTITADTATDIPLSVVGAAVQSGNYFNVTSNGGSAGDIFSVNSEGGVTLGGSAQVNLNFPSGGALSTSFPGTPGAGFPDGSFYFRANQRGLWFQDNGGGGGTLFGIQSGQNGGTTSLRKGADVASAAAITPSGNIFHVTGTTNITSITSTTVIAGTTITIIFDDVLTFTDGSNLKLAGNFVTTADDTITLTYDGTNWYEVARAVN